MKFPMLRTLVLPMALLLAGCATAPQLPAARLVVFGEQHDQPDHKRQVADAVHVLARAGRLGAVVIEMAEQGRSTASLPVDAHEAQVRDALDWNRWSWDDYRPIVMGAVRAGVPVFGGNLPRSAMRDTMNDASLDQAVEPQARERIAAAVRQGHCGMLPAAQEPGMVRVQIARDRAMARTVETTFASLGGTKQVLLLAGAQHASRDRGVPLHLTAGRALQSADIHVVIFGRSSSGLRADEERAAVVTPRPDPCEELRRRMQRQKPPPTEASAALPADAG